MSETQTVEPAPMVGPWVRWFDPADAWKQCADPYCLVCRRCQCPPHDTRGRRG